MAARERRQPTPVVEQRAAERTYDALAAVAWVPIRIRGHFPTEQAALNCLYLVTRSLDPKGTGQQRWTMRWKPALNAFAITFGDRMPKAEQH